MSEPAVGFDLGTTFATIAQCDRDGRPVTVRSVDGAGPMPAVVYLERGGAVVGEEALRRGEFDPLPLARNAKRDMGERAYRKSVRGRTLPAAVVQALVLRQLKAEGERRLGSFTKGVVTVPACFDEPCRQATAEAARLAGIDLVELLDDPLAAVIAHGALADAHREDEDAPAPGSENVLVCDLGGGTFDATLVRRVGHEYRVLATEGDVYLGGIDFDRLLVGLAANRVAERFGGFDPRDDEVATEILSQQAVAAKHALTDHEETTLRFRNRGDRIEIPLTREDFDGATSALVERARNVVRQLLETAGEESRPERLLLAGGSTRMSALRAAIEEASGLTGERLPEDAVAHGAARFAESLLNGRAGTRIVATSVAPRGLALLGKNRTTGAKLRVPLVDRGTSLPVTVERSIPTLREGQDRLRFTLVEGVPTAGDAIGASPTIGRGVISGLPEGLPARTLVRVTFTYGRDGRLALAARLAEEDVALETTIERVTMLGETGYETWAVRVANNLAEEAADEPPEDDSGPVGEFDLTGHGTTDFDIDVLGIEPTD